MKIKSLQIASDILRRRFLDNGIDLGIIPRTECIRIVSGVIISPDVDITLYPEDAFSPRDESAVQYTVKGTRIDGVKLMSLNDVYDHVSNINTINKEVR